MHSYLLMFPSLYESFWKQYESDQRWFTLPVSNFLVWHVGHRTQQLNLKFPIRKEERRENRLTLSSFLLTVKLQSSQVKRTPQDTINEFIIRKLNALVVVDFRFISAFLHA